MKIHQQLSSTQLYSTQLWRTAVQQTKSVLYYCIPKKKEKLSSLNTVIIQFFSFTFSYFTLKEEKDN